MDKPLKLTGVLLVLALISAVVIIAALWISGPNHTGCYDFADGTLQGWTLDQIYDGNPSFNPQRKFEVFISEPSTGAAIPSGTPFTFANHQSLSIEANASMYIVADPNVNTCDIYFESQDLSGNTDWQNAVGYKLDIEKDIVSAYGDPNNLYNVQLQVIVSGKLYVEADATGKFIFHPIEDKKGLSLEWKPPILLNQQNKITKVRIRCTMPGYVPDIENQYKGSWRIGNVCPIM